MNNFEFVKFIIAKKNGQIIISFTTILFSRSLFALKQFKIRSKLKIESS